MSHRRAIRLSTTGRAEALSDGVFAIVITLMAIDLRPPDVPPGRLLDGLLDQWPTYLAFVTSFVYISVVWLNHKATFKRLRAMDRGLHWANVAVLFTATLVPFPTAVIAEALEHGTEPDKRVAVALYALIGVLICLSWLWFFHRVSRYPDLVHDGVEEGFFHAERIRALAGVALYAAAAMLGYLVGPTVALAIFLTVPAFFAVTSEGLYDLPLAVPVVGRRVMPRGYSSTAHSAEK